MQKFVAMVIFVAFVGSTTAWPSLPSIFKNTSDHNILLKNELGDQQNAPCTCGVFLNGQFKKGTNILAEDERDVLRLETGTALMPCGAVGNKKCLDKCIETMVSHMSNAGPMICASIDRDCIKERAYLFTQNCNSTWRNTNFTAGKEFCCKNGSPYKCPRTRGVAFRKIG